LGMLRNKSGTRGWWGLKRLQWTMLLAAKFDVERHWSLWRQSRRNNSLARMLSDKSRTLSRHSLGRMTPEKKSLLVKSVMMLFNKIWQLWQLNESLPQY
jgi:hypothetical protein